METVKVKNVVLGTGRPKVVVPMVGVTEEELIEEAEMLAESSSDLVEWRVDYFEKVADFSKVATLSRKIAQKLQEKPLLFTFRTQKEGGKVSFADADYFKLYFKVIQDGVIDLLDVELFMEDQRVAEVIAAAHKREIKIVMCNHDFEKTPSPEEIVSRLCRMQEKGADICKIAVMPNNAGDVLALLAASNQMQERVSKQPIVTIAMGRMGILSRISGELFGSSMTFAVAEKASAPGQIPIADLQAMLQILSLENLNEVKKEGK